MVSAGALASRRSPFQSRRQPGSESVASAKTVREAKEDMARSLWFRTFVCASLPLRSFAARAARGAATIR
jgi:hypothetical protein